ncbi:MAG: T9SS type A sorting domain-containing protein, partial [Bacteroidota bacterium]
RLVATIAKQVTPSYSIDYENKATNESIPSTDEYSYDNFASGGTDGNGQPLSLSVPEYGEGSDTVYLRTKANDTALASDIQALEIPERPASPAYSIDYSAETTAEAIAATDEYSLDSFATAGTQGDGTALNLSGLIPAYGSDDEYVYFRSLATASSFVSSVQNLVVPAREASPVVSLSDQSSANACFMKSADGTGDTVSTADGYEYTLDQGSTWNDILDATTVDSRGDQDIRVRVKATGSAFASESTENLDGDLVLSNVSANVAEGLLQNTLTTMEYSLNSTDGTDGDWHDCSNTSTSVIFIEGPVYVREKANTSNYRLVIQVQKSDPPSVSINYEDETTAETIPSAVIYSNDNFASDTTTGAGTVIDLNVPAAGNAADTLYFMTKANASELASEVVKLTIPARPEAPSVSLSDQDSPEAVFVKPGNDTVATSDGMQYSTDGGTVWYLITDTTTVNTSGSNNIIVRKKATMNSFASESTGNLDIITGIDAVASEIKMYPNPVTNGVIHFTNIDHAIIRIYSINGKMIMARQMNNESKINVSDLQKGTYIVVISQNGKIHKKTFIVF